MDLSFARFTKAGKPGPDNRGIYCDDDGVFIGPDCALVRAETDCAGHTSYMLRPRSEIAHLLDAGYGTHLSVDSLMSWLNVIAKALNDGDMTLARIATLQLPLFELSEGEAANRMAAADRLLKAGFNPDEPRDWHGRWTTAGGTSSAAQQRSAAHRQPEGANTPKPSSHVHFSGWGEISPRAHSALARLGDRYYEQTGAEVTVTSGRRTPRGQAQAMYDNLRRNRRTRYANEKAYDEILKLYNDVVASRASQQDTVGAMTRVIEQQVSRGVYISAHLTGDAVDVRSRDMSLWQRRQFQEAVRAVGARWRDETDHYHLQF